ncbi:hypothetical protein [Luteibaculum oceani]|uniref:Uncharacterized protein n=1 Tax=Luteibaculum oceani TaxID=1294296 RepID=A0A5C6V536_9FLAO|nr:hypothetical protein [Luteibaculum oceani]TXC78918.1 hypothetical protein FRX97_06805 [Luteibaculum oceani]
MKLTKNIPATLVEKDLILIISQLEKDLGLPKNYFGENLTLDLVKKTMFHWVDAMLEERPGELFQALYKVDLPDHITQKALKSDEPATDLSLYIIYRVYLKVKLRQEYGSN